MKLNKFFLGFGQLVYAIFLMAVFAFLLGCGCKWMIVFFRMGFEIMGRMLP